MQMNRMRRPNMSTRQSESSLLSTILLIAGLSMTSVSTSSRAQVPKQVGPEGAGPRTVIKQTVFADPKDLLGILSLLDLELKTMPGQNTLVIRGDSRDVEAALKLIENLDMPQNDLEIECLILGAGPADGDTSRSARSPAELEPLFDRLQRLLGLENLVLLDTVFLRTQDGKRGIIQGGVGAAGQRVPFTLSFNRARIVPLEGAGLEEPGREGSLLRFEDLSFNYGDPDASGGSLASLRTNIEVREGQRAVVGRATPRGEGQSLVLVLRAEILD